MPCILIAGGQWGDEGKGKIVAYLSLKDKPDIVARAGVGPNAGHTVYFEGKRFGLRQVPCGFVNEGSRLLIGPGVLVNPEIVLKEAVETGASKRLGVDRKCTVIEPTYIEQETGSTFLSERIGTTRSGCGPANVARVSRIAKLAESIPELEPFLTDVPTEIHDSLRRGGLTIIEGSQGFGLSLVHGTYPYVTSKDTSAGTLAADVGIGPTEVDEVMLVFKAYVSRVGAGPFPTEMSVEESERLGIVEYVTVTGRRRRIGSFDFELAKRASMINGATQLVVTCIDRLFKGAAGVKDFDGLPKDAKTFVERLEQEIGVPVTLVSTGVGIEDIIDLRSEKLRR